MKNKSGVALSGMLMGCLAGLVLSSALNADAPSVQDPSTKNKMLVNPANQRVMMIQELQAINARLAEIHKELKNLEKANSGS